MPTTRNTERSRNTALAHRDQPSHGLRSWGGTSAFLNPFELMDRMNEEFDRVFRDFGLPGRPWFRGSASAERVGWSPRVEAFQKGDQFIVRAELPGLKKDDVQVELTRDTLTIHGERRDEHEEQREGYYHSERQYGQFYRAVPLPEAVIGESAQATFKDGVLEVRMQAAPADANRGRRLEIKEGSEK